MNEKETEVAWFLHNFKRIVTEGRGLDLIPRPENNRTVIELGFTKQNIEDEILALSVSDCCEGPLPDYDRPGEVWIFGREVNGKEIYIKLKIAEVGGVEIAKCISFHIADYPLRYLFQ